MERQPCLAKAGDNKALCKILSGPLFTISTCSVDIILLTDGTHHFAVMLEKWISSTT